MYICSNIMVTYVCTLFYSYTYGEPVLGQVQTTKACLISVYDIGPRLRLPQCVHFNNTEVHVMSMNAVISVASGINFYS